MLILQKRPQMVGTRFSDEDVEDVEGMDKISKVTNPYQILQHAYTHA